MPNRTLTTGQTLASGLGDPVVSRSLDCVSKVSGSKDSVSKTAVSKTAGSKMSGSKDSVSKTADIKILGSEATGSKMADSEFRCPEASRPKREGTAKTSLMSLVLAISAFGLWGINPLYFYLLRDVPPLVTLMFRSVCSSLLLVPLILLFHLQHELLQVFRRPKYCLCLFGTMLLLCGTWGSFIWLVAQGKSLQASLGSYISPLLTVLISVTLLHETLRWKGWVAIVLAFWAVLVFGYGIGVMPWGALLNAVSFASYSVVRKILPLHTTVAVTMETLLATPFALAFLFWASGQPGHEVWTHHAGTMALLCGGGVLTAAPLVLFGVAIQHGKLSTLGILQYLIPSIQFICAVVILKETMTFFQWISFGLIWAALFLFACETVEQQKLNSKKRERNQP